MREPSLSLIIELTSCSGTTSSLGCRWGWVSPPVPSCPGRWGISVFRSSSLTSAVGDRWTPFGLFFVFCLLHRLNSSTSLLNLLPFDLQHQIHFSRVLHDQGNGNAKDFKWFSDEIIHWQDRIEKKLFLNYLSWPKTGLQSFEVMLYHNTVAPVKHLFLRFLSQVLKKISEMLKR